MKVVLFCGGLGTRLREYSETVPKPMVNIGYRPDPVAPDEILRPLSGTTSSSSAWAIGAT